MLHVRLWCNVADRRSVRVRFNMLILGCDMSRWVNTTGMGSVRLRSTILILPFNMTDR